MTFGKRTVAPSKDAQAEEDACPLCRGVGAIRARGQRKVCVPCKGTGKKPKASEGSAHDAMPPTPTPTGAGEA
jgi:DnaJ-class molecular chaperone